MNYYNYKKYIIIFILLLPIIIEGCSRSNYYGITLDYNIDKKDVGKITFYPSGNKKGMDDMTSAIDTLFCKGDTLFISYKRFKRIIKQFLSPN